MCGLAGRWLLQRNGYLLPINDANMSSYILVKYLHIISILSMVSLLVVELFLLKAEMTRGELKRLSKVDGFYGLASILVVVAGLMLWFGVGKGDAFYDNPILHIKVGIAVMVGLISVVPTVFYVRQSKGGIEESVSLPARIRQLVILQLILLAVIPLLAVMMAQGIRL
jgi:putative membrane protein